MVYRLHQGMVKEKISKFGLLLIATAFVFLLSFGVFSKAQAEHDPFPSTNEFNQTAGNRPYVTEVSKGIGQVTLEFVNGHSNSLAFFEYRIDGEVLTTGTPHANPCKDSTEPLPRSCNGLRYIADDEVTYPGVCVDTRAVNVCPAGPETRTFFANEKVEVRLALGGERSWDFDWVEFFVIPDVQTKEECKNSGWAAFGFRNQGLCIQYVNTGKDSRQ